MSKWEYFWWCPEGCEEFTEFSRAETYNGNEELTDIEASPYVNQAVWCPNCAHDVFLGKRNTETGEVILSPEEGGNP